MTKVTRSAPRSLLLPITAPARPTQQTISINYNQDCTIVNGDQHNNAENKSTLTKEDLVDVVAIHHIATRKIFKEAIQIQQRSDKIVQANKKRKISCKNHTMPSGRSSKEMPTPLGVASGSSVKRSPIRANSNSFANASVASKVSTPKSSRSSSVNPFANVSFAAAPAGDTIEFGKSGPIATSTMKLRPIITSAPEPFTSLRQGAKEHDRIDIDDSTKNLLEVLEVVQKEVDLNPTTDLTQLLNTYIQNRNLSLTGNANEILRGEQESEDLSSSKPSFSFTSAPATPAAPKAFTGFSSGNTTSASNTSAPTTFKITTPQPAANSNPAIFSAPPASIGWGNTFALKLGEWRCTTCRSKNLKETGTCLSCGIIKESDGGNGKAATATSAVVSTTAFFDRSKVDGKENDQPATGGFTFAAPTVDAKNDNKPVTGVLIMTASKVVVEKENKPVPGGSTFAAPAADAKKEDKPVTGSLMFEAQPSTTEKKDDQTYPH